MTALATLNNPAPRDSDRAFRWQYSAERNAWVPDAPQPPTAAPVRPSAALSVQKRVNIAEAPDPAWQALAVLVAAAPMKSGPCKLVWMSHKWDSLGAKCERCDAERF